MVEENGMRFPRVRSPQQNHVRLFNLAIRARPPTSSENRRQTGDAGGVSSPVAAVDIVRPHHAADEFLRGVVDFIDGLRTTEHPKVSWIVFRNRFAKSSDYAVYSFIPSRGTMNTVFADQGLSQA
jgi:hypothetical protein